MSRIKHQNPRQWNNVDRLRQKELLAQYPDISRVYQGEASGVYKRLAISVFDHWLSAEEAARLLVEANHQSYCLIHKSFNLAFAEAFGCLGFRLRGRFKNKVIFKTFTHQHGLQEYLEPASFSVSQSCMLQVVLPEISAIYFEGFDSTNYLYYRDEAKIAPFLELARKHGLYISPM